MDQDLAFERLENRMLLAGNITAYQKGATLYILGDAAGNDVDVDGALDADGNLVLGGVTVSDGPLPSMTKINNSFGPEVFYGIRNIVIQTGDGDDLVRVQGVQIQGDLKVNLGAGVAGDEFILKEHPVQVMGEPFRFAVIGGSVSINAAAGADNDGVVIQEARIGKALTITTGAGMDDVRLWQGALVGGKTSINTGADDDAVLLSGSLFNGAVVVNAAAGDDVVSINNLFGQNIFHAAVTVGGGAGIDVLNDDGTSLFTRPPRFSGFEL